MPHFNIPIFIPELACPFRCVYCNQYNITGSCKAPTVDDVKNVIDQHLTTLQPGCGRVEVAFFGGSFTGLSIAHQNEYLQVVQPYLESGRVDGIRISTRPDYISQELINNLSKKRVVAIELGAQSMDEEVLNLSGRGHTPRNVVNAAGMIKDAGFELGLQMMTGLPGDTPEKSLNTAHAIIELQADNTRIYPTLVIRDTPLEALYLHGKYSPQTIEEAIALCAQLYEVFQQAGVKVLRMGLHPAENFLNGQTLVAGPFHQAFGEQVMTQVWHLRFALYPGYLPGTKIDIYVNPAQLNAAIGYKALNRKKLQEYYRGVYFTADASIKKGHYHVDIHR